MTFSEGALRLGVLYDLLGRYHHHDLRDATVSAFGERLRRRPRPRAGSGRDGAGVSAADRPFGGRRREHIDRRFLEWAAMSPREWAFRLPIPATTSTARTSSATPTCRASRGWTRGGWRGSCWPTAASWRGSSGSIPKAQDWRLILCLRLSVVVHRARDGRGVPPLRLKREGRGYVIVADSRVVAQSAPYRLGAGRRRTPVADDRPARQAACRARAAPRSAAGTCRALAWSPCPPSSGGLVLHAAIDVEGALRPGWSWPATGR
jgi:hypothetical protein